MYLMYKYLTSVSAPLLNRILQIRLGKGKEDPERINEKKAIISRPRPAGALIWIHAASVGEAQSALILIKHLLEHFPSAHILITTGTLTSATIMESKLPPNAFHQFYPLDHPTWVNRFLDHWSPNAVLWMESELWPNMLRAIKDRNIPSALINARMSKKSFKSWRKLTPIITPMLSTFNNILCQTEEDATLFKHLGAKNTLVTDNLKYSAQKLPSNSDELQEIRDATYNRPIWLYASTHAGEEKIACNIHQKLKADIPDLLTIIVPRHPERRDDILKTCSMPELNIILRTDDKVFPTDDTDIYIADTLGELGLFYRLAPIAVIGRSLSDDGGGGHNPIEAAQLGCVVLHGPNVQNLQDIFDEMDSANAAIPIDTEQHLYDKLHALFNNPDEVEEQQNIALTYSRQKVKIIDTVRDALQPILHEARLHTLIETQTEE